MRTNFTFFRKDGLIYDLASENGFMAYKPEIELPLLNAENIKILGRRNSVTKNYGTYEDRKIVLPIFFLNYDYEKNFNRAFNGITGNLKLSYKNGYFKVSEINSVFVRDAKGIPEIDINITIRPFLFLDDVNIIVNNNNTKFYNHGTESVESVITIYGNGDCTFYINNNSYRIENLEEKIVLNSETLQIYKNSENQGEKIIGDLTKLLIKSGKNDISWIGEVSKVAIKFTPAIYE